MCRAEAPLRFRSLEIREDSGSPWTHRFLVSRLLPRLSSVTDWTWFGQPNVKVYDMVMPWVSTYIPVIIRHTFTNVRELVLQDCNLTTWTHFAQFIFAFPALDILKVKAIPSSWSDRVTLDTPPRWLRFTQRLRIAHFSVRREAQGEPYITPCAWLFFAGRQYSSASLSTRRPGRDLTLSRQDSDVVSRIITHVFNQIQFWNSPPLSSLSIRHAAFGDGHCKWHATMIQFLGRSCYGLGRRLPLRVWW